MAAGQPSGKTAPVKRTHSSHSVRRAAVSATSRRLLKLLRVRVRVRVTVGVRARVRVTVGVRVRVRVRARVRARDRVRVRVRVRVSPPSTPRPSSGCCSRRP